MMVQTKHIQPKSIRRNDEQTPLSKIYYAKYKKPENSVDEVLTFQSPIDEQLNIFLKALKHDVVDIKYQYCLTDEIEVHQALVIYKI